MLIKINGQMLSPTDISALLRDGKLIKLETNNNVWIMYYQNNFPFEYRKHGNAALLKWKYNGYECEWKSEWNTGSGIVNLINYIIQREYKPLNIEDIQGEFIDLKNVTDKFNYAQITDHLEKEYLSFLEFIQYEPETKEFDEEVNNFKKEYLFPILDSKELIDPEILQKIIYIFE